MRGDVQAPFFVVFTDLDGTLLDHFTYDWSAARPALDLCRASGVALILVSSKTRAEIDVLREELSLEGPFISENGGGIFFPPNVRPAPPRGAVQEENGCWKITLGVPYRTIVEEFRRIRDELGWGMRGFSDMDIHEIMERTGLDEDASRRAAKREFDEPFVIDEPSPVDESLILTAVKRRGLGLSLGGRFHHLHGGADKGRAVKEVLQWYGGRHGTLRSMALGDGENDVPMFKEVDFPVLVRSPKGVPMIQEHVAGLVRTHETGPRAWNKAVSGFLLRDDLHSS